MSLLRKIFGNSTENDNEPQESKYMPEVQMPDDELFIINFKKNGGKFLYSEDIKEFRENFHNILIENQWTKGEVLCYDKRIFHLLEEVNLKFNEPKKPLFFFTTCEGVIAEDGSVLFCSNQIKLHKPNELPTNVIVLATTSQILGTKSDGLREIRKNYLHDYPSNITTIKCFEKNKEKDFLNYGSAAKNLYLLLLEN
jgi:LUD domain